AKVLAKELEPKFNLIRLDMSDFSEKHNVARLVGAPPGYVGFGEGGELTRKIEEHPNSVVLFDEIEKAHPDVLNILLQILEEGELKDGQGNISNFKDSLVILTSNLGTSILHNKNIGFKEGRPSDDTISTRLQDNLKKILKPELINRLDNVIVFKQLSTKSQEQILGKMLNELRNKLRDQEVILTYDSTFVSSCAHLAYSKEYGAREIRRFLDTKILDQIANVLLNKEERPIRIQLLNTNNKVKIKVIKDAQAI
ncbi:ATP-dependent Clp protease ATP-binding subunit, partial [candidate division WWE3 bacterium]|nr:ATP-dependent Clp protease ATP-binding subunit [candidate division WWE3 bacterium]